MEQSQKLRRTPYSASLNNQTWEETGFAEDSITGTLGHCIWPPRSYSCTFCKREFRSAQALGGHMNIHRRERAMLKQITTPCNHGQYLGATLNSFSDHAFESSCLSSFRSTSALSHHFMNQHCFPHDDTIAAQEPLRFYAQTSCGIFGVDFPKHGVKNDIIEEGLFCQSDQTSVKMSHKRARTSFTSLSSILNPCSTINRHSHVEGMVDSDSISTQGIDLELRLGGLPKLKY